MKYFRHQRDDIQFWTDRAHSEAEHGYANFAAERLGHLAEEFPGNPHIAYDRGLIALHHLGRGEESRHFFVAAHRGAVEQDIAGTQRFAARYLARLASTPEESRQWAECVLALDEQDRDKGEFGALLRALDSAEEYPDLLWISATECARRGEYGLAAGIAEVYLGLSTMAPLEEASHRLLRSQWLRALDQTEMQQRASLGEIFPAEERLAREHRLHDHDSARHH